MKVSFYVQKWSKEFVFLNNVTNIRFGRFYVYFTLDNIKRPLTYPISKIEQLDINEKY